MEPFPNFRQLGRKDCGPTCIKIILKYYGKDVSIEKLRTYCKTTIEGTSLLGLRDGAEQIGLSSVAITTNFKTLLTESVLPCIIHWKKKHYVVVYKATSSKIYISDPARGLTNYNKHNFIKHWMGKDATEDEVTGVALVFNIIEDLS